MENFILLLALFIGFELFESNWQKADTFYGMLKNNYQLFEKNIILYLCMHPAFFFTLYLSVVHNLFDIWIITIVAMKFFEIIFKLNLMQKIQKDEPITDVIPNDVNVSFMLRYTNVILYPMAFLFSVMG